MEYIVLSVPHTGTRTLQAALGCSREHTTERMDKLERIASNHIVAVPLRNPIDVWASWVTRNQLIKEMRRAWEQLFTLSERHVFTYVPVDVPKIRDKQLGLLGRTYDWGVKHGQGEGVGQAGQAPQFVLDLYDHPLLAQYYERGAGSTLEG